ncbi:MAG: DUF4124 domain-containing protein [Stenotrophobium sp.]
MRGYPIIVALALLLLAPATQAEVYRCQKDGVTVFSDKPCAANAEAYRPAQPLQVIPHDEVPDLTRPLGSKLEQQRKARDQDYAKSNKAYQAQKDDDERLRAATAQRRVAAGMSAAQVRSIMGEPLGQRRQTRKGRVTEVWTYQLDDGSRLAVSLHDGKVVSLYEKKGRAK